MPDFVITVSKTIFFVPVSHLKFLMRWVNSPAYWLVMVKGFSWYLISHKFLYKLIKK